MPDTIIDTSKRLVPYAHIHGEPLMELPQDLYIPPDALELVLETFQGPLKSAAVPDSQAQPRRLESGWRN